MVVAGLARKESRGAHARPYDYPDRDDENFLQAHDRHAGSTARPSSTGSRCDDEVAAAGAEVLMRRDRAGRASPLLALALAGCGGGGSDAGPRAGGRRQAAAADEDRRTPAARSSVDARGRRRQAPFGRRAATSTTQRSGRRQPCDLELAREPRGGTEGSELDAVTRSATSSTCALRRSHAASSRPGKPWLKIDLERARRAAGASTSSQLTQSRQTDPTQTLAYLQREPATCTKVGTEDGPRRRRRRTTRRTDRPPSKAVEPAPPAARAARAALERARDEPVSTDAAGRRLGRRRRLRPAESDASSDRARSRRPSSSMTRHDGAATTSATRTSTIAHPARRRRSTDIVRRWRRPGGIGRDGRRAQDLAVRPGDGRARAAATTRSRRPSGRRLLDVLDIIKDQRRRHARLPQELPDDDLRLVRDAHGRRARCSPARSG